MPMPDIDMNSFDSYTAMLLYNSPVRNRQNMYSYQPYAWNAANNLNTTHYYNEQWLNLSLPQHTSEATYNLMPIPLNQIPMESSEPDMNHFDNNSLFFNPEMHNMDWMMFNTTGMNAPPPTLEISFGGRMIQATPIELNLAGGFEPIMVHGPQVSGQTVLHAVRDANNAVAPGLTNKDFLPIPLGNYRNHIVEHQELDEQTQHYQSNQINLCECNCLFCRTHRPMSPDYEDDELMDDVQEADNINNNNNNNNVIVIDDDDEDDDYEGVDNNDDDDDDDMNSESGYEIYVPPQGYQDARLMDIHTEFDRLTYEQILAIQEEIGYVENGVPHNMLEQALKRNKFLPFDASSSSSSNASCSICWDEFKVGQDLRVLKCGHKFNYDCIKKWLMNKKTCPLCRESVL